MNEPVSAYPKLVASSLYGKLGPKKGRTSPEGLAVKWEGKGRGSQRRWFASSNGCRLGVWNAHNGTWVWACEYPTKEEKRGSAKSLGAAMVAAEVASIGGRAS